MIRGRIVIDAERCKGCELCGPLCPLGVIHPAGGFNSSGYHPARLVDPDGLCTGCAVCALVCPEVAITVFREARRSAPGMPTGPAPTGVERAAALAAR